MSSLATLPDTSADLVARIQQARALLDEGDLKAARVVAGLAYDEAKAVASSAERVKASRQLIDKARRMQADALYVESQCIIRMADAVDEAQAKGQLARAGRPKLSEGSDNFSLDEVGLDRRRLKEARELRNAERSKPGFLQRVIDARLAEGLEPSRAGLRKAAGHAIGTKTASAEERGDDLYETPIEAIRALLALESFSPTVLEPSVGKGAILRPLEAAGYEVMIADLVDRGISTRRGEAQQVGDFLAMRCAIKAGADIVTNPPFGIANAYAAHAMREFRPAKMALLLNLNFMCGFDDADRRFVMDENPPSRVYVFTRRLPMMHRDGWDGPTASSQMNCAWFVWERNVDGSYGNGWSSWKTIRLDWMAYRDADSLPPGEGGHMPPIRFLPDEEDFTRATPRKTLDERVGEEIDRARDWARAATDGFSQRDMRVALGVRDSTAEGLILAIMEEGLVRLDEEGGVYRPVGARPRAATGRKAVAA